MNSQEVNELLDPYSLWLMVDPEAFHKRKILLWKFPKEKTARLHLRAYEPHFANWGWQHRRPVSICGGGISWSITPRREQVNLTFIPYPPSAEAGGIGVSTQSSGSESVDRAAGEERFLVFAESMLNSDLVDRLAEMKNSNQPLGIIDWTNQQQICMNAPSQQIPIGSSLIQGLQFSRYQYWLERDLDRFLNRCREELDQGGSNAIVEEYLTFDPLDLAAGGNGDWMWVKARFTFLDCGRFGMFQLGENLDFRNVAPPN